MLYQIYEAQRSLLEPFADMADAASKMLGKDFVLTDELKAWGGCKDWTKAGEPSILFAPLEASLEK